jgi:drug/metabolite transporter (DMT)-like permease
MVPTSMAQYRWKTPLLFWFWCALFHEPISIAVVAGILSIAVGVMFIGVSHKLRRSALVWALLTGTCIAAYTVIDAQGVRAAPTAMSYIVWTFILLGGGLGTFFALWRGRVLHHRLAALRETSILFGTAIAVIFLKERLTRLRLAGVVAIAAGAMVLIGLR